jgi:hypothetical protein
VKHSRKIQRRNSTVDSKIVGDREEKRKSDCTESERQRKKMGRREKSRKRDVTRNKITSELERRKVAW